MDQHALEISRGERFTFGDNWSRFLSRLNESRILEAERSLKNMLGCQSLAGKRFLDMGSGSGLFSLAARRLGAIVYSFDYDPQSAACTTELRRQYFPDDRDWWVGQGSALDETFLASLGSFDIVYSWGVLHHTGAMWKALDYAARPVGPAGTLFISIYNDQGSWSRRWTAIKRWYNRLPKALKLPYALLIMLPREAKHALFSVFKLRPGEYTRSWTQYGGNRGMNKWHDWIDWVGGYPFEVAKPEEIFDFYQERGFSLRRLRTCGGGLGCNEFVFTRETPTTTS